MGGAEDRVGAALVPGRLGDVALGGGLGGGVVGGVPEGGAAVGHVEVGAPDGDVVGRAGEAVDGEAVACGLNAGGVAAGGAGVSAGEKDGDALRGGLLPEGLVEGVAGGAEEELALAIAVAHDRSEIVVDDVEGGEVGALHDLGALGDDVVDGGALGDGAGPLGVDVGLALVAGDAGVGAVVDDVEVLGAGGSGGVAEREVEELAEVDEVGGVDVGLADDGDGLAGAVDRSGGVPERKNVVDGGEVVGSDAVGGFAALLMVKSAGLGLARIGFGPAAAWCGWWRCRGGSCRAVWLAARRGKLLSEAMPATTGARAAGMAGSEALAKCCSPLNSVAVHAGAEGGADHAGGAAEFDEGAGGVDLDASEVVVLRARW